MKVYKDVSVAILDANVMAPHCVGYKLSPEKDKSGWVLYDPLDGAPEGVQPEFLCMGHGKIPTPLNPTAEEVQVELMKSVIKKMVGKFDG